MLFFFLIKKNEHSHTPNTKQCSAAKKMDKKTRWLYCAFVLHLFIFITLLFSDRLGLNYEFMDQLNKWSMAIMASVCLYVVLGMKPFFTPETGHGVTEKDVRICKRINFCFALIPLFVQAYVSLYRVLAVEAPMR